MRKFFTVIVVVCVGLQSIAQSFESDLKKMAASYDVEKGFHIKVQYEVLQNGMSQYSGNSEVAMASGKFLKAMGGEEVRFDGKYMLKISHPFQEISMVEMDQKTMKEAKVMMNEGNPQTLDSLRKYSASVRLESEANGMRCWAISNPAEGIDEIKFWISTSNYRLHKVVQHLNSEKLQGNSVVVISYENLQQPKSSVFSYSPYVEKGKDKFQATTAFNSYNLVVLDKSVWE